MNVHNSNSTEKKESFFKKHKETLITTLVILLLCVIIGQFWYIIKLDHAEAVSRQMGETSMVRSRQQPSSNTTVTYFEWDPFEEMRRVHRDMNRLFRNSLFQGYRDNFSSIRPHSSFFEPDIDIQEHDNKYVIAVDVPGLEKENIRVTVKDNYLTIEGERKLETQEQSEDERFFRMERSFGSFQRTIPLPGQVDETALTAEYKKGVLTITLPKLNLDEEEKPQGQQVKIN
ncbi:Hsp20/alpha crystallin family protein [Candidatus Omnitrophota bacterium]